MNPSHFLLFIPIININSATIAKNKPRCPFMELNYRGRQIISKQVSKLYIILDHKKVSWRKMKQNVGNQGGGAVGSMGKKEYRLLSMMVTVGSLGKTTLEERFEGDEGHIF